MSFMDDWIRFNLMGRIMMLASTIMSWRAAEWFMSLDDPTAPQSAFCSVIMGVYTGVFGIWMGKEGSRNPPVNK